MLVYFSAIQQLLHSHLHSLTLRKTMDTYASEKCDRLFLKLSSYKSIAISMTFQISIKTGCDITLPRCTVGI